MQARFRFWILLALAAALPCCASSAADKAVPSPAREAFNRLKGLAGEWHGRVGDREKGEAATVIYRVTAAGNTVQETLFPGSPHEMVTMYFLEEGKLVLTHYCAAGNQPQMALTRKSTPDVLEFNFIGGANIKSRRDGHMHSARLRFESKDTIAAEWDYFEDGKRTETKRFFLTRKKDSRPLAADRL